MVELKCFLHHHFIMINILVNNFIFWSYDLKNYRKSNWWNKTASTNISDKITIRTANTIKKYQKYVKDNLVFYRKID